MLVVSVHDVAPSTIDEVRWLLARLDDVGVARRVLKAIPAEPGADSARAAALVGLLRDEAARGSEIVLHGWTHHADGPRAGTLLDRARARLFAGDAAEFLSLDRAEMEDRLGRGREWLAEVGLGADGFGAPAWLANPELADAARAAGFHYLVWLRGLRDLRRRRWLTLPPVGYLGAGAMQEALVQLGATLISRPLVTLLPAVAHRVVLHPQGAPGSAACRRVLQRVARLAATHQSTTYGELLGA